MNNSIAMRNDVKIRHIVLSLLLMVGVSFFLVLTLTPDGVATTPDSLAYIYAAKSVAHGGELGVPDFKLMVDSYDKAMTSWPSFYPTMLSLVIHDSFSEESIRFFNCIMLSTLIIFYMFSIKSVNFSIKIFGAFVLLLQTTIITVYTYAWSEVLFLPLLMAAYFFCVLYCRDDHYSKLLAALTCIILASYTRYIGIVFLFPIVLMIWFSYLPIRKKIYSSVVSIALICLAFMPIIFRNIKISGVADGEIREASTNNIFMNISDVSELLSFHLFGIWDKYYLIYPIIFFPSIIFFIHKKSSANHKFNHLFASIMWPFLWAGCYLGAIIVLRAWKNFDALDTRLISPAIIFLLLGMMQFIGMVMVAMVGVGRKLVLLLLGGWGIWLTMHGVDTYSNALINWRNQASHGYQMNKFIQYGNFTSHPGFMWMPDIYDKVQQLTQSTDPVIIVDGSQSMMFKHLTNAKVKELPFTIDESIVEKINKKGSGALVITTPVGINTLSAYYGKNIARLSSMPALLQYNVLVIALPLPIRDINK